jgi:hypothetical protein
MASNKRAVADDRMAARVGGEGGGEEEAARHVVGVVQPHVDLAADDVLFFLELVLRQGGRENHRGEDFEEGRQAAGRAVDVVNGAVEGGVGVPVAAGALDGGGELVGPEAAAAFENHVLQEVRDAGPELRAFVEAAAFHPELGADDRRGGIGVEDEGQSVGQAVEKGGGGRVFHEFPAWRQRNGGYTGDMQRWIVLAALVLCLLGGGTVFGYWKYKQNQPEKRWVPLPFNPDSSQDQRKQSVIEMRERLLTDAILTGVVRDCDVQGKWKLASEQAAVADLKNRVFVDEGEIVVNGVPAATLNIGFRGKFGEREILDDLAERLMEDVKRLIAPPPSPGPSLEPTKF